MRAQTSIVIDVGRCIYCTQPTEGNLTREHVIPVGLGGGLILLNASCGKHREMTREFEDVTLHKTFGAFRHQHKMRTGKKKQRPKQLPITLLRKGEKTTAKVELGHYPDFLFMPIFEEYPGLASGRPIGPVKTEKWRLSRNNEHFVESLRAMKVEPDSAVVANFNINAFVRMISKIAHGIAWAYVGGDSFEPWLIELIEGTKLDVAGHLIGVDPGDLPATIRNSHIYSCFEIETDCPDTHCVYVKLRLWAGHGMPTYGIVVGAIRRGIHDDW